jgi:hypothetical protein
VVSPGAAALGACVVVVGWFSDWLRKNQSTLRSRPSASAAGVMDTYSCSRICEMMGEVSVARR